MFSRNINDRRSWCPGAALYDQREHTYAGPAVAPSWSAVLHPGAYAWLGLLVLLLSLSGCGRSSGTADGGGSDDEPFVLGDLVEDFDPPTLSDLEAQVQWIDKPVLDAMQLMRERKEREEEPELSIKEALALRNDTPEKNKKIAAAMGRLPKPGELNPDARIVRNTPGDVKSTNPLLADSTTEFDVNALAYSILFSFDWNFIPHAFKPTVVSWQSSKDGLYDKVILRDDWTWSDGKPVTAHDVEFSYKVIMSSKVPVPAQRSGTDQLKYVKAYDDQTVVFFHKESQAINHWNIYFSLIPKHVYEDSIADDPTLAKSDYHVKIDRNPVTNGPFVITKREPGQEVVLERRESYYMHDGKQVRDKPNFQEVRFKVIRDPNTALLALKKGDIEEMYLTPEQWQTQTNDDEFYAKNTKAYDIEWVYFYFGWNCKTPYFSDKRVRQAMSWAFDHETMLKVHRHGLDEASNGVFHRTSRWAPKKPLDPPRYVQDLEKAEQLLAEAGWEDHDGDGILDKEIGGQRIKFEFSMITMNRPDREAICNLMRENLERIGIICHVRPLEFTTMQDRLLKHKFQASFGGWGTGADPDTSENLWTTKAIDNGRNHVQYSNPEIDKLFEEGKRQFDLEKRAAVYARIHEVLWEDQPYTWLFFRNSYYGFNKQLRGYNFSPRGPYNYGPGFDTIWKPAMQ